MARTTWRLAPWYGRRNWLFLDGTIEQSPAVETTPSQRRWRIKGTDMSVPKHELTDKITDYMRVRAHNAGTDIWLEITEDEDTELTGHVRAAYGGYKPIDFTEPPEVSFANRATVPIAFEFVHANYPLRVLLWVILSTDSNETTLVSSQLTYRPADPLISTDHTIRTYLDDNRDGWVQKSRQRGVGGIDWELKRERFGTRPRMAASRFLELLQQAQEVDTVSIPDGRDPTGRTMLDFAFTRTNYTQDLYRQVLDVVQSGPAMERLTEHLKGVRRELSNLGLVVQDKDGFNLKELLNGKLSEFQVQLVPQEPESGNSKTLGHDPHHKVHLDLANGVFTVSCARQRLEEVAEQWNIAKFKAEVTGETDVLVAYAEAYNDPAERARLRKIVNERRLPARGT